MKVFGKMFMIVAGICLVLGGLTAHLQAQDDFSVSPTKNDGQKWRIGYYEGGPYIDYQKNLIATINGLMALGWIESQEIPEQEGNQTQALWNWLATEVNSDYIEFVADAHYSTNWDQDLRQKTSAEILERLNTQQDIDLMIAMGTWAGQDLATDAHSVPVIVESTSNPIASNIVKSVEDSGYDHVLARVAPYRYERQVQIFYDIIGFQKLGVAYKNDTAGRSYAAMDDVEKIAGELGFEIVSCELEELDEANTIACFEQLCQEVHAIYVTIQKGVNKESIPTLVEIANKYGIPTFSQSGSEEVKYGFLMSISTASFKYVGQFYAENIAKIFNNAKPRELDQLFEDPQRIAINLKTAEVIGYDPPVDVLGIADEIYQEIETP